MEKFLIALCPTCQQEPEIHETENTVLITCATHPGHMAMGSTLSDASIHWTIYVRFVRSVMQQAA